MIKDAKKYAATTGVDGTRFNTMKLVSYGETALFSGDRVNCHRAVAGPDLVIPSLARNPSTVDINKCR